MVFYDAGRLVRTCLTLVIISLAFVVLPGGAGADEAFSDCSPSRSYEAARAIEKHIFEYAKSAFRIKAPEDLPADCDLLPWKDVHHAHNELREPEPVYRRYFKCKKCGKQFKTTDYLDRHIAQRHVAVGDVSATETPSSSSRTTTTTTCGARFCAFLPCDKDAETVLVRLHEHHPERARVAYECRRVMARCFPPSLSEGFKRAHEYFESLYCDGQSLASAPSAVQSKRTSPSSSLNKTTSSTWSIWTILSKTIMVAIVLFYLWHLLARPSPAPVPRGLGPLPQQRPPPPQNRPEAAHTPTPVRRRAVGSIRPEMGQPEVMHV